jgi:hypothetical protein
MGLVRLLAANRGHEHAGRRHERCARPREPRPQRFVGRGGARAPPVLLAQMGPYRCELLRQRLFRAHFGPTTTDPRWNYNYVIRGPPLAQTASTPRAPIPVLEP